MTNPHLFTGCSANYARYPLPAGVRVDRTLRIGMDDGVMLAATLFSPEDGGAVPVVIALTPYGKDNDTAFSVFSNMEGSSLGTVSVAEGTSFEAPDPGFWVPKGYAILIVDVRGQGQSLGETCFRRR